MFALVAAAGELATGWSITGWPEGEAVRATEAMVRNWIADRGGESGEERDALAKLRDFIGRHGASRFELVGKERPVAVAPDGLVPPDLQAVINRAGYKRWEGGDDWSYYILPSVWDEIHAPADGRTAARLLADRGVLKREVKGNLKPKVRTSSKETVRAYHVISRTLHADAEDQAEPKGDTAAPASVPAWRRGRLHAISGG